MAMVLLATLAAFVLGLSLLVHALADAQGVLVLELFTVQAQGLSGHLSAR